MMDCYEAMQHRHRLFNQGKISPSEFIQMDDDRKENQAQELIHGKTDVVDGSNAKAKGFTTGRRRGSR